MALTKEQLDNPIAAVREMGRERLRYWPLGDPKPFDMIATPLSERIARFGIRHWEEHEHWPESDVMAGIALMLADALDAAMKQLREQERLEMQMASMQSFVMAHSNAAKKEGSQ